MSDGHRLALRLMGLNRTPIIGLDVLCFRPFYPWHSYTCFSKHLGLPFWYKVRCFRASNVLANRELWFQLVVLYLLGKSERLNPLLFVWLLRVGIGRSWLCKNRLALCLNR